MIYEILMAVAALFAILGAIGFFRFPDFYTRIHAATMVTVGGSCLALLAVALNIYLTPGSDFNYVVKIILITILILITGPVSSHAIADAAYATGIKPQKLAKNEMEKGK